MVGFVSCKCHNNGLLIHIPTSSGFASFFLFITKIGLVVFVVYSSVLYGKRQKKRGSWGVLALQMKAAEITISSLQVNHHLMNSQKPWILHSYVWNLILPVLLTTICHKSLPFKPKFRFHLKLFHTWQSSSRAAEDIIQLFSQVEEYSSRRM